MKIEKLNHQGHGIGYQDQKITFVAKALPGDDVEIKITKTDKKINEAVILKINEPSPKRIAALCPHFNKCGGCDLLNLTYEDTLAFKKQNVKEILLKYANLEVDPEIIASPSPLNYRNKITLKIKQGNPGYYEEKSHSLVKTDECLLAQQGINNFIKDIPLLKIKNGQITIRANYNDELLIVIDSKDKLKIDYQVLKAKHKIVGFIINKVVVNGDGYFIDRINNHLFQVSYNSFFQVNRAVSAKIFDYCLENIKEADSLLDLYCGVGTLSNCLASKFKTVYGIEIVHSAIKDALVNNKINKVKNIKYLLGDVATAITKIEQQFDTMVIDPPRAGIDRSTIKIINEQLPNEILYISCNAITLARDLKLLAPNYTLKTIKLFDMFPYTAHVECVVLMSRNM